MSTRAHVIEQLQALIALGEISASDAGAYLRLHDIGKVDLSRLDEDNAVEVLGQIRKLELLGAKKDLAKLSSRKG